jgi:PKD domain
VWEEISYGGTDFNGKNYGWSDIEGPCLRGKIDDCPVPTGNGVDPYYFYQHDLSRGASIVGAVSVPKNLWPPEYKLLIVDHSEGALYNLIEDKECRSCTPPTPGYRNDTFHKFPRIVDTFFGPYKDTQALYYVSRDKVTFNVRRIYYTGSTNNVPKAAITGLKMSSYIINDIVRFKGLESIDNDGDKLKFFWDFGDGQTSSEMNPNIRYSKRGTYDVTLTVTDSKDQSDQDTAKVVVGDRPSAKLILPAKGSMYEVGETFRLKGYAFDSALNASIDDPSQYYWEVRQYHENHYHPFLDLKQGNDFDLFPTPPPEDFYAATNSYLKVYMTVYDSDGVSRRVSRILNPRKVLIKFESKPSGLKLLLDNIAITTPATVTTWQNQVFTMEAPNQDNAIFSSWSIGGNQRRSYLVPKQNKKNTIRTIVADFTTE